MNRLQLTCLVAAMSFAAPGCDPAEGPPADAAPQVRCDVAVDPEQFTNHLFVATVSFDGPVHMTSHRVVSDRDGILAVTSPTASGDELEVGLELASEGLHTLTFTTDAPGGPVECTAEVAAVTNTPPTCVFLSPVDGGQYADDENLLVDVQLADAETLDLRTLTVEWAGIATDQPTAPEQPDSEGVGQWYSPRLAAGQYTMTAAVYDELGLSGTCLTDFTIVPADP